MDFSDLLASSDALLCKPGYGSFVEAASSGVPVIYVSRADWPESPALITWLQEFGRCVEVSPADLEAGNLADPLRQLWTERHPTPPVPTGASEVANWLASRLN
jgi:UDP-N-acetylglucosamine:LPS N-acetylglucosamine transferase